VFRAGVELIQLDVSVLNDKREPVRGLTLQDFTVLENGVPRPIRAFTAVDLPARTRASEPAWAGAAPPDIATNQIGGQDGRLVMILMDRSIPHEQPTVTARKIATGAVEALGPHDMGALVSTSGGVPQLLTADRARLIEAINRRDWSTDSDVFPWRLIATNTADSALSDGRCLCGLCVLETITAISNGVRAAPRKRKVLLFIGAGVFVQSGPRAMAADVGCDNRLRDARRTMFDSLALSNLTVHSIDPRGLVTLGPQTRASTRGGFDRPVRSGPFERLEAQREETTELLATQGTLQVLPEQTGGRAVMNTNAPEQTVPDILRESEAYYVLGFERGTAGRAEVPRALEVKVARTGLHVHAQRQYVLPSGEHVSSSGSGSSPAPTPLESALRGLLPAADRPLTLAVAAFASLDGPKVTVTVSVDATSFTDTDRTSLPFDIGVSAVDQMGREVASAKQTATVLLPPIVSDSPESTRRTRNLELQTHLDLEPGDYELRAAVMDQSRGRVASVFSQLLVPAFADAPLSLSGLVIGTRESTDSDPAAPLLPIVPTTQRAFHPEDQVWAFLQVYEGTQRTDALQPVSLRTTVVDEHGRMASDESVTLAKTAFVTRRAGHRITLPLEQLAPGRYLLRIEATLGRQTASRAVPFVVE
jgi:VWFA-related protein